MKGKDADPKGPSRRDFANLGDTEESDNELNDLLQCSKIEADFRTCSKCGRRLHTREFPLCGKGFFRSECKTCYRSGAQVRRKRLASTDWRRTVSSLPVEIRVSDNKNDWINTVFNFLRTNGYFSEFEKDKDIDVDQLLNRENKIGQLIGKEGK